MSPGQWLFLYGAKDVLFDVLAHLETALTLIQRITRIRLLYLELAFLQFKLFSSLIFPLSDPLRQTKDRVLVRRYETPRNCLYGAFVRGL